MTPKEVAVDTMFRLYDRADHVAKLVENARIALANGDLEDADKWLSEAEKPARFIEMLLDDTRKSIAKARDPA